MKLLTVPQAASSVREPELHSRAPIRAPRAASRGIRMTSPEFTSAPAVPGRARRRLGVRLGALLGTLALLGGVTGVAAAAVNRPGPVKPTHTVTYDQYSFMVDGKRLYLWSGEFHYYRQPSPGLWRDALTKMKAAGFNATSLYFDWAYHSSKAGSYDFTGIRDLDRLLDMATEVGIYVIARPGPYINAEVDSGGFPG